MRFLAFSRNDTIVILNETKWSEESLAKWASLYEISHTRPSTSVRNDIMERGKSKPGAWLRTRFLWDSSHSLGMTLLSFWMKRSEVKNLYPKGRFVWDSSHSAYASVRNDMSREIPRRACALARNDIMERGKSKPGAWLRTRFLWDSSHSLGITRLSFWTERSEVKNLSPSERYCMRSLTLGLRLGSEWHVAGDSSHSAFDLGSEWHYGKGEKVNRVRNHAPGFIRFLAFARNDKD